jgi:hypothetical protein
MEITFFEVKYMNEKKLLIGLLAVTLIILILNSISLVGARSVQPMIGAAGTASSVEGVDGVIPTGVPAIYGEELGVSFDAVSPADPYSADATIAKLKQLDLGIVLTGADLNRYTNILYTLHGGMSCEYCCGAQSIVFANGDPACGCAHSYAMRGLAKYLISEHGDEYTDEEILSEVGKWKTLFFPTQMQMKAGVLTEQGVEFTYINLASNKYRGIEKGAVAGGGMVGGC